MFAVGLGAFVFSQAYVLSVRFNKSFMQTAQLTEELSDLNKNLEGIVNEDNLYILTESKNSGDIYKAIGSAPVKEVNNPAELKIGHGQVSEKKTIPGVKNIVSIGSGSVVAFHTNSISIPRPAASFSGASVIKFAGASGNASV